MSRVSLQTHHHLHVPFLGSDRCSSPRETSRDSVDTNSDRGPLFLVHRGGGDHSLALPFTLSKFSISSLSLLLVREPWRWRGECRSSLSDFFFTYCFNLPCQISFEGYALIGGVPVTILESTEFRSVSQFPFHKRWSLDSSKVGVHDFL